MLTEVERLLDSLTGRTVITADHGEILGERHRFVPMRDYGHHKHIFNDPTIKIPWLVIDDKPRKTVVKADTGLSGLPDPDNLDERLENLGYKLKPESPAYSRYSELNPSTIASSENSVRARWWAFSASCWANSSSVIISISCRLNWSGH